MMRLQRVGRRNEAHFKIVVIEKTKGPKSQKYIDILGSYNPKRGDVTSDESAVREWLAKGVQPSDTVFNMLVDKGLVEGKKKNVLPKKSPTEKRNAPAEEPAKEAPAPVAETPLAGETSTPVDEEEQASAETEVAEDVAPVVEETPEPVAEETPEVSEEPVAEEKEA